MWKKIKKTLLLLGRYTVEANEATYYTGGGWSSPDEWEKSPLDLIHEAGFTATFDPKYPLDKIKGSIKGENNA